MCSRSSAPLCVLIGVEVEALAVCRFKCIELIGGTYPLGPCSYIYICTYIRIYIYMYIHMWAAQEFLSRWDLDLCSYQNHARTFFRTAVGATGTSSIEAINSASVPQGARCIGRSHVNTMTYTQRLQCSSFLGSIL